MVDVDIPKQPTVTLYSIIGDWGVIGLSVFGVLLAWLTGKVEARTASFSSPQRKGKLGKLGF